MSALEIWYPKAPESPLERVLRSPLSLASFGFRAGVAINNALFDSGVRSITRIEGVRVLSVGNITVGGSGKTPVVIFLASHFLSLGHKVAVLSRGYGRSSKRALAFDAHDLPDPQDAGDEPVLIAKRVPGVRVYVGADRVERAFAAKAEGATLLLLDDGMQHRRLARDVDIAVIDEAVGLGNGALLPRGPLREPPAALSRAQVLWLRASDAAAPLPPFEGAIIRARHSTTTLLHPDGSTSPAHSLSHRSVVALCALARPSSFVRSLEALGAKVEAVIAAPDHHRWTPRELEDAEARAAAANALLVTTEKDAVKLPPDSGLTTLRMEVELLRGAEHLDRLLADPPKS